MQVGGDALLVAVEHREKARPGAEQPARSLAIDRLDLDDLGAHVREDHPTRRAHHHVREFDHAQAGQRLRSDLPGDLCHRHEELGWRPG